LLPLKLKCMPYKVIDIEGIGPTYAEKLGKIGINTTGDLLEKGATKTGRSSIAQQTGLPESLILTWVNHSDLFRIKGIASQFAELLEASGVDTVKEFATRNAESLHKKLVETNEKFGLSGKVPSTETLQEMIAQAKTLVPKISH
jgi:predicted flap endonuclease-1-like 5' DNA nuclease